MKVLKFGGTSVGSVDSILSVKKIVEAIEEPVIVVVSALGGITDKLLKTASMATNGDVAYEREFSEIVARHLDVIQGVIPDKTKRIEVQKQVMALLDELGNIYKGVYLINDLSAKTSDTIVSYGERISSLIVSNVINEAKLFDSRKFIKTVKQFNKHIVDFELTNRLIEETFDPLPKVSLVPGFISSSKEGEVTNLGRGGSDYTASILATALNARRLEIWTDVDGFMTADPRVISSAYVIDRLTFTEAMELCNFGAKVIYPPTIYPVYHKNIPIRILNTFNPTARGTYISKERVQDDSKAMIKGISSINDTCLITVQGLGMVGVIGVNYRIFKTLAKNGISVFMVSQASSENNTTFAVRNADADLAVKVLDEEFALERAQGDMSGSRKGSGHCRYRRRKHETHSGYRRQVVRNTGQRRYQRNRLRTGGFRNEHFFRHQAEIPAQGIELDPRLLFSFPIQSVKPFHSGCRYGRRQPVGTDPHPATETDAAERTETECGRHS